MQQTLEDFQDDTDSQRYPVKEELWARWVKNTVLPDIKNGSTPDPVPLVDTTGEELTMADSYDSYRLGHGSGDYLYLLYLAESEITDPSDIIPVYIGETNDIATRLRDHVRKLLDAVPISDWEDGESWGNYGKYDHIATVYERVDLPLCAWVSDVSEIRRGPYGFPTYRQELEAKTVGLVHSSPHFERVFANREFVPNRVAHEMGKAGPEWVETGTLSTPTSMMTTETPPGERRETTKPELWHAWIEQTLYSDIEAATTADPIPLFETDSDNRVALTEAGSSEVLRRSDAIDARIRQEGSRCVHENGVTDGPNGLIYVMYQCASDTPSPEDIIPRYIGKAEAYGKKNELSANFEEIAKQRESTRSFARWGDGSYWHVGELSETVFGDDSKKVSWASELFEQGTHTLKEQTYLWVRAWDPNENPGPYGYPTYIAELEALLIGLAYATYPEKLLNHAEVPEDAPANERSYEFRPV